MILNLNDLFWTIQGEGFNAGRRALFVRMPFCNLRCSWCDTSFNSFKRWDEDQFVEFMNKEDGEFAVITGGEPLMNPQTPDVIRLLKGEGFKIACETNGTQPYIEGIDWVTCSPKRDSKWIVNDDLEKRVAEYKYVVDSGFDFAVLDRHNEIYHRDMQQRYLSPEFTHLHTNALRIIEYIKENPEWKLSLQTHKWIGIP